MTLHFKIYLLLILTGVFAGLVRFRKLDFTFRILGLLLFVTFVSESISRVLARTIRNSNPVYHFYSPLEIALTFMILFSLTNIRSTRNLIRIFFFLMIFGSLVNSIFFQHFYEFNSNVDVVKAPVVFLISSLILLEWLNKRNVSAMIIEPAIMVLCAFIWFNIASFIFFISYNYLLLSRIRTRQLGSIHYFSNLIYYGIFVISLFLVNRRKKYSYE